MLNLAELANAADLADSVIMSTLLKAGIKLSFKITSSLLSTSFGLFSFFFLIIGFFLTTFLGFFPPLDGIPSSAVTFLIVSFFAISFCDIKKYFLYSKIIILIQRIIQYFIHYLF